MEAEQAITLGNTCDYILYDKPGTLRVTAPHEMLGPCKWKEAMEAMVAIEHKEAKRSYNQCSAKHIEMYGFQLELVLAEIFIAEGQK